MAASPLVYALGLVTAVLWGASPIFSKRGQSYGANWLQNTLVILTTRAALFWVLLLAFTPIDALLVGVTGAVLVIFLFAGAVASGFGRLVFYVGVERVGASVTSAFTNVRPLITVLIAIAWLGEAVTPQLGVGVVVLVIGLSLLSLSRGGDIRGWRTRDLVFPLLAATAFAIGNTTRRFGLTVTDATVLQAITINETAGLVVLGAYGVFLADTPVRGIPRRSIGYFGLSGLFTGVGLIALFEALDRGPVSIVDPLTATGPLFTLILAYALIGDLERVTRRMLLGIVLAVIGAGLITATGIA